MICHTKTIELRGILCSLVAEEMAESMVISFTQVLGTVLKFL